MQRTITNHRFKIYRNQLFPLITNKHLDKQYFTNFPIITDNQQQRPITESK